MTPHQDNPETSQASRQCQELEHERDALRSLLAQSEARYRAIVDSRSWRVYLAIRHFVSLISGHAAVSRLWLRTRQAGAARQLSGIALLTAMSQPVTLRLPSHLKASNPSIVATGDGWLGILRAHNYRIAPDGRYLPVLTEDTWNENWLVDLDDSFAVRRTVRLRAAPHTAAGLFFDPARNGFQDCRLFPSGGDILVLASAANAQTRLNTMALARLSRDELCDLRLIRSPTAQEREKNWMPVAGAVPPTAVHSISPLRVVDLEFDGRIVHEHLVTAEFDGYRGSSQFIPFRAGWLGVIHRRIDVGRRGWYLHRLVFCDQDWSIVSTSEPFFFEHRGIEFCAGLACKSDRFVFSYSVEDETARLLELDRAQIDALLAAPSS